jgi:membrane fusion protein, multidrug efflux system
MDVATNEKQQIGPATQRSGLRSTRVRSVLLVIAGALAAAALVAGVRWLLYGRFVESTDDAYLRADVVTVAPRISGYVDAVYVVENQQVVAGQPLLHIDPRNYQAALAQQLASVDARSADIKAAQSQIAQQEAQVVQYRAQLAGAEANARFAAAQATRYQSLRDQGVETEERYEQALNEHNQTAAAVHAAIASVRVAERQLATLESQMSQTHAQLEGAQAAASAARLNVDDTVIRASISGRIGDDTARLGQYVGPGTRLMSIVPVQDVYLVANFKETQLRRMRIGQPASVKIDALGEREIPGRVESFSPGTGAEFALLPPENATGNFIKIVQRVPVRVHLTPPQDLVERLLPGLSVTVSIDTNAKGRP